MNNPQRLTRVLTDDEAEAAYKFWRYDRKGWPLDRALRVWLAYEALDGEGFWWNPDDQVDSRLYDQIYNQVNRTGKFS